jgi:hypothetical protein
VPESVIVVAIYLMLIDHPNEASQLYLRFGVAIFSIASTFSCLVLPLLCL